MKKTIAAGIACALLGACAAPAAHEAALDRIDTIVIIYAENHSFDNMYGLFPGANGIANASTESRVQRDHDGAPLPTLPSVWIRGKADDRYPTKGLPNGPFRIDAPPVSRRIDEMVPSPIHAYYHNREQIDGGRNDRFVAMSDRGAWVMGYYDGSSQKVWQWAKRFTLADNFFMGAFGGSFLNHQWLVCACTPVFPDAPASMRAQLDERGNLRKRPGSPASAMEGPPHLFDGSVSPDGYAVNTMQPAYQPSGIAPAGERLDYADPSKHPLPPQTSKTIGDTLSAKGISWAWYGGGWNAAVVDGRRPADEKRTVIYSSDRSSPSFQAHHQPFNYFARFAPGTPDRAEHLRDGGDFLDAIAQGTLPHVAFYKPNGQLSQHPGSTDIERGDIHIDDLLSRLEKSAQWPRMLVVVTYDENGGYWDHVAPPSGDGWGDRWGPGSRIPTIIVSPLAKRGFVDHTSYDTTSILKLITERFGLEPLPGVRRNAGDLTNALQ
jgi:phospholipase C